MSAKEEAPAPVAASRAPRAGLQLMGLILVAMALLSLFTNYQKAHVQEIEQVTIIPPAVESSPTPAPSAVAP